VPLPVVTVMETVAGFFPHSSQSMVRSSSRL